MKTIAIMGMGAGMFMTLAGCGEGEQRADPAPSAVAPVVQAPSSGLVTKTVDPAEACGKLMPEDIYALGVSRKWSDNELKASRTYGRRVKCTVEGFDPDRRVGKAVKFFEFEVESGIASPEKMCADKVADAQLRHGELFPESVDGALCHTLSTDASNNFVVLQNGCFFILYAAQPDIMGVDAETRNQRRKDTKLAVARAITEKINGY